MNVMMKGNIIILVHLQASIYPCNAFAVHVRIFTTVTHERSVFSRSRSTASPTYDALHVYAPPFAHARQFMQIRTPGIACLIFLLAFTSIVISNVVACPPIHTRCSLTLSDTNIDLTVTTNISSSAGTAVSITSNNLQIKIVRVKHGYKFVQTT